MPSVNTNELHWTAETERLATCSTPDLRKKAAAWLPWRSAPKAPTLLRHALMEFAELKIAEAKAQPAFDDVDVAPSDAVEHIPTTSQPVMDRHSSFTRSLVADGPTGVPTAVDTDHDVHHVCACEPRMEPADSALLENHAKEITWLRRTLEQALRRAQEMGARLLQPGHTPEPLSSSPALTTKDLVFFGLPLGAGASAQDASTAVHKFCSETLHLPDFSMPDIVRVVKCSAQTIGHRAQRPATVVVARLPVPLASAVCEAKRRLPSTCLVSIDGDCSRKERLRRQKLRQQRREVVQGGGEKGLPYDGQEGGEAGGVEGEVPPLH